VFLLVESLDEDPFGFVASAAPYFCGIPAKKLQFLQSERATRNFGLRIFLADVVWFRSATVDQFIG
jgi:hypothetical protein